MDQKQLINLFSNTIFLLFSKTLGSEFKMTSTSEGKTLVSNLRNFQFSRHPVTSGPQDVTYETQSVHGIIFILFDGLFKKYFQNTIKMF